MKYQPRLHVVLHQPEIPQNTGNVGRTCVAAGAKLWLVRPLGFRLDDRYLRRAGLDYWRHLEWEVVDHWEALCEALPLHSDVATEGGAPVERAGVPTREASRPRSVWFYSKKAARCYTQARIWQGDALVFGSETQGLSAELLEQNGASALRIPTRPQVRSLNLSSAVAVAVYEALRQWESQRGDECARGGQDEG